MRIAFLSLPYRGESIYKISKNIEFARKVSAKLWEKGYCVICPHLNSQYMDGLVDDKLFLMGYMSVIDRLNPEIDAVFTLKDSEKYSEGVKSELEFARSKGITVYNFTKDQIDRV